MTVTVRRAQLQQTLKRLAAEARSPDDHHQLDAVRDQLRQDRFRVLVAGEAKRGKSTLLNALLGRDVLPTGAVPVTALATTVRDDGHEGVTVRFADGRIEQHPSQSLPGFVTQAANPDNRLFVAEHDGTLAAAGACNVRREIILNYVSPEHRFVGASTALLAAMEQALGPGEATLTSTATAHRFYLSRGWQDAGPTERYAGMVVYPMRKTV